MGSESRYRFLPPEEVAELSPTERALYEKQRREFMAEVERIKFRIKRESRLEVRPGVYLPVPVPIKR